MKDIWVYASGRGVIVVAAIALQVDASQKLSCIHQQANGAAPCALKIDPIRDVRDNGVENIYDKDDECGKTTQSRAVSGMIVELGRDDDIQKEPFL